jgi:lactonase
MNHRPRIPALLAALGALSWVGVGNALADTTMHPAHASAHLVDKVADDGTGPAGTSLEGASFNGRNDELYFADTTAATGAPKLLALNLATAQLTDLYTDSSSALNCIVFRPSGIAYICDLGGHRIARFNPPTRRATFLHTNVKGQPIIPDDLTFNRRGDMYITDYRGSRRQASGSIVERTPSGALHVLVAHLVHPNGIALSPDGHTLWTDEDLLGKLVKITLSPRGAPRTQTLSVPGIQPREYTDSLTTDSAGNIYMAVYGGDRVDVFDPAGRLERVVRVPASVPRVSHVAIKPGTRHAYLTTAGPSGGYIYTFRALAPAPAYEPNGG